LIDSDNKQWAGGETAGPLLSAEVLCGIPDANTLDATKLELGRLQRR
jgi:hypothetical protein